MINESAGSAIGDGDASYDETDISANGGDVDLKDINFGQGNSNTETNIHRLVQRDEHRLVQPDGLVQQHDNDGIDDSFNYQSQVGTTPSTTRTSTSRSTTSRWTGRDGRARPGRRHQRVLRQRPPIGDGPGRPTGAIAASIPHR